MRACKELATGSKASLSLGSIMGSDTCAATYRSEDASVILINAKSAWKSGVPYPVTGSHPEVAFQEAYGTYGAGLMIVSTLTE